MSDPTGTSPAGDALVFEDVHLAVGGAALVAGISARIEPGGCLVVMGASGSGKSSLLAWAAGTLDRAFRASGRIRIGADDLAPLRPEQRRLGLLFQDDLLFPHLSVAGNLLFALPADVRPMARRRQVVAQALAGAGLAGFDQRDPSTLSGGQRARVALLRTLQARPRALLLDEPFSKLDSALRTSFRHLVFEHAAERGLPMVLVTHDAADADAAVNAGAAQVVHLGVGVGVSVDVGLGPGLT